MYDKNNVTHDSNTDNVQEHLKDYTGKTYVVAHVRENHGEVQDANNAPDQDRRLSKNSAREEKVFSTIKTLMNVPNSPDYVVMDDVETLSVGSIVPVRKVTL